MFGKNLIIISLLIYLMIEKLMVSLGLIGMIRLICFSELTSLQNIGEKALLLVPRDALPRT